MSAIDINLLNPSLYVPSTKCIMGGSKIHCSLIVNFLEWKRDTHKKLKFYNEEFSIQDKEIMKSEKRNWIEGETLVRKRSLIVWVSSGKTLTRKKTIAYSAIYSRFVREKFYSVSVSFIWTTINNVYPSSTLNLWGIQYHVTSGSSAILL